MKLRIPFLLALPILLPSCDGELVRPAPPPDPVPRLALSGTIFRLGSDDSLASPEEKPGWTRFSHDLWMDPTEMTQKEFRALLGRNPSSAIGDSLPVTDVSWFDAILAANARSRRDGLDSVYEYSAVLSDSGGNAAGLSGLAIHLDRGGWRLPTEAEWEAAARAGSSRGIVPDSVHASTFSWFRENSDGRPHPVATKAPNAWGLHDMAGNVMEWVNDWKGPFPEDTVEDFAGPETPADIPEIPLKGGAYIHGVARLRPSGRTATYAAFRSSRAEYVGFRLARGAFAASYTSSSGKVVHSPPVALVRTDVARIVGSWEARLAFVSRSGGKGTLVWIDYGEATPTARSLPDKDPVFHPAISPDGRWVAWSTVLEGSTRPGRIKARRLARNDTVVLDLGEGSIPRWWVSGTDTFLVRADPMDDLASGWASTKTTARRWSGGALVGAEQVWASSGSYHDGRSGSYLYTGYRHLMQFDVRNGRNRVLFTAPANGKGAGDTSQVCNASAAPDSSGRVMFLDFGYGGKSSLVGRSYGIHEVAFVADSSGNIVRQILSPPGTVQWEHLEWSNSPKWAVSVAAGLTGIGGSIHLLDVDSGTSVEIAATEQPWQPALWTGSPAPSWNGDDADSLGQYFKPSAGAELPVIGANLLRFWLRRDSIEIALVGSSQINGFVPANFPSHDVASMAWSAAIHADYDSLLRNYIVPHSPRLRAVLITLMPGWFFPHEGNFPNSRWSGGFTNTLGQRFDVSHGYWASGTPAGFEDQIRRRMKLEGVVETPPLENYPGPGWGAGTPETNPATSEDTTQSLYRETMARMRSLLQFLTSRGIHVVLLHNPERPDYRNLPQAGLWGPSWEAFKVIMDTARAWERRDPRIHLYDANLDGMHDYVKDDFVNENHMTPKGLLKLGLRLDSLFTKILAPDGRTDPTP